MSTINLLPPQYQRVAAINHYRNTAWLLLFIVLVACGATYFTSYYLIRQLKQETAQLDSDLNQVASAAASYDTIATQATTLATQAQEVVDLNNQQPVWPVFFSYLEDTLPPDVSIRSIVTAAEKTDYAVTIGGVAASRKSVGVFREKLLQYKVSDEKNSRISQAIIDSITDDVTNNQQLFSLHLSMNMSPEKL